MAISTGLPGRGERRTENGAGGAAFVRLCAAALVLLCFPPGVRWGCAPQTAPKSLRLSGLSSRCGGAALVRIRCACASLRNHISIVILSAGSTLGLRAPNLRQRVECGSRTAASLDSLHAAAGLRWCGYAPSPGYTERPGRVQFMLGRVGLYSDDSNSHNRRPARLRPMVGQVV